MKIRYSEQLRRMIPENERLQQRETPGLDVVSFEEGLPADELIPVDALGEAAQSVLGMGGRALLSGPAGGLAPLRERLCERMAAAGMTAQPEQTIVTSSSLQAIDFAVRVLAEPGDTVLVERPANRMALQLFRLNGLQILSVDSGEDGMDLEEAGRLIREKKTKLIYVMPTFGDPTGRTWSEKRRLQLLELCGRFGVSILEDDPYGAIKFGPEAGERSLFALQGNPEDGPVIYIGTYSSVIAPSLQTAWAASGSGTVRMMERARRAAAPDTGGFEQRLLEQLLRSFPLEAHIRRIGEEYGRRMRDMQAQLRSCMPGDVSWTEPRGGLFLWLELPEALDAEALLRCALLKGAAFIPGAAFYVDRPNRSTARLSFAQTSGERMAVGIARIAEALEEFTARR
ncbi:PLP-dependent aminotransferase family protein [Paenibacillus humicola]|uniref:aminotransferase-like domain-containing protein n=1 Tax=Paenibacillus humicola TaxID=3110540 RepID=UPI00237A6FB6|nr:PLP-dependent aminotransferase family protein [Paenibacillus humicola]